MTKFLYVFSLLFILSSSIKAQNSKHFDIVDAEAKQWYDTLIMPSVAKVQPLLDTETAFISYFLTEKLIYVHFLTDKTADLYRVPINKKFPDLVQKFRNAIINQYAKEYSKLGFQLYKKLFPMTISKNINNLVIDNNKILYILPFENLLMSNKVKAGDYKNLDYLVKSYSVSYQSIYYFEELVKKNFLQSSRSYKELSFPIHIYINKDSTSFELLKTMDMFSNKIEKIATPKKVEPIDLPNIKIETKVSFTLDTIFLDNREFLKKMQMDTSFVSAKQILIYNGTKLYSRGGMIANIGLGCEEESRHKFSMLYIEKQSYRSSNSREMLREVKLEFIKQGNAPYTWAGWVLFGF